jgi:hypothetical protein
MLCVPRRGGDGVGEATVTSLTPKGTRRGVRPGSAAWHLERHDGQRRRNGSTRHG